MTIKFPGSHYLINPAFRDECSKIYDDEEHSDDEERFILIGYSKQSRLLMVCHCYRTIP